MVRTHEMDMTKGPILKKIIICAIPLICTNLLQFLFNATDIAIVGIFVGDNAVAAVGSNSSIINLIIGLFVGLSAGSNVLLAKAKGANDKEKAHRIVGASVALSLVTGFALIFIGVFGGKWLLKVMSCPEEVIDMASLYLTIYFIGMPVNMLYNFLAAILRAVGDNVRPMYYMMIGGALNVGLNIFFVAVCNMTVEGVAIATVVSQAVSAMLCLIAVIRSKEFSSLKARYIRFYKEEIKEILLVGLPSGLQACLFSLSNIIMQSSINKYGADTLTANSISIQFESIPQLIGNAVALTGMSFVSQNFGAGNIDRVKKVVIRTALVTFMISIVSGGLVSLFSRQLIGIMTDSEVIIEVARERLILMALLFFIGGIMDVVSLSMRALGKSITSMIICLMGVCAFRVLWLNTFYLISQTYFMIILVYPISWFITLATLVVCLILHIKKLSKTVKLVDDSTAENTEQEVA